VDQEPETITDQVLTKNTKNVPPVVVQPSPTSTSSTLISSSKMPEVTKDTVQPSTKNIQPRVAQTQVPINELVVAPKPKPTIPYPSRANKQKLREKDDSLALKFLEIFKNLHFELSFTDPRLSVNENCSAVILKKLLEKLGDLGKFLILCDFPELDECLAQADLGASINLMPLSIWKKLSWPELSSTQIILELADRSATRPASIAEDVFVKVGKFHFLTDFVVIDYVVDPREDILLLEELLNKDPSSSPLHSKELNMEEIKIVKSSIDEPPELELKELPSHLEYAFLEGTNKLPVIISKDLKDEEKSVLLKDDFKPAVQHQKRVNPKIHEVIKKEVIKLLDVRLIYPISDSMWVSPVHCVPKKGGMTIVENEDNELISTRSSSKLSRDQTSNPTSSTNPTPKGQIRRSSKQKVENSNFEEHLPPVATMADNRTMAEMLCAPTEGCAEAIVVPPILAEQFELKHSLINMMTSKQFFGLEKDNSHDHIRCSEIAKLTHAVNQQTSAVTTAMTAMLKQLQANPPPAQVKAVVEICVTCGGAHPYYQCLAVGGNTFPEFRDNIKGYVSAAAGYYNQGNPGYRPRDVANQMRPLGSGSLPGNTVANPKGKLKAITTRSGLVTNGPTIPTPPKSVTPEDDECVEETYTNPDLAEYTIKVKEKQEKDKIESKPDKNGKRGKARQCDANPEILFERASVLHSLQELDKLESIKVAQKAKIKWAIEGGNSCFIVLIPKAQDAKLVKDFRPITLIGSLYKIIAKILANRLVVVLGDIVDFDKACDSVRWDYLNDVLKKFGFKDRWCSWIHNCLRSSRGSVMVNRSPTCEFQFHKGMFRGISLGSSLQLFHLFYANDAVFIGHWSESNIHTITPVLSCFYRASGLRINMNKSKLMGVFVENNKVEQAITKIGCSILKAPFSYLGSKVGGIMSRIQSWNEVVTKLVDRLSKWKLKTLSIGGRLTLLKAVLGSMPIFHMSLFKVPANVLQRMEAIRCHFFNGVDQNDKKRIWVK
nr:RNA-directed DNA polymerase, eukaryota [Tanacetum cinerariifolium]